MCALVDDLGEVEGCVPWSTTKEKSRVVCPGRRLKRSRGIPQTVPSDEGNFRVVSLASRSTEFVEVWVRLESSEAPNSKNHALLSIVSNPSNGEPPSLFIGSDSRQLPGAKWSERVGEVVV